MTNHGETHQVTLRTPAELADALPYLLGYHPEDSIVLVALHDREGRGRFGGRARLGIPANPDDWPAAAQQLTHGLVTGSERRGARPESMVVYLCQEPAEGEARHEVRERLRPLAQLLRTACGRLDVPVVEALCIADNRFWSYCCVTPECCPDEGVPMGLPGTSVLAAAATYAGLQVRGTLSELRARFHPWETAAALEQEHALDTANARLVPRILDSASRADVAEETLRQAHRVRSRFADAPAVSGTLLADLRDDELLTHDEAATLILGLQDRTTRDRAAEWMEGDEAAPALRLWRALARRCVGPYREHAAAPLTLAGWVAWSTGDDLEAREALAMALGADPGYLFARLLHQACNEGLDPESIRRCLRAERGGRAHAAAGPPRTSPSVERAGTGEETSIGWDDERGTGRDEETGVGWDEDPEGFEATERFGGPSGVDYGQGMDRDSRIDGIEPAAPSDAAGPPSCSTSVTGAARALESATRRRRRVGLTDGGDTRRRAAGTSSTRPQTSGRPVVRRPGAGAEGTALRRGRTKGNDA
ncbi:DUF4192 domain-containing protein [Streptomyces sp. NPDC047042]|uniref:DUF4192 domain-containing protein n=1 Tax=Streptomyces sp. NPDC047042 TaxID=3154807 RepID=UPI0033FDC23D